MTTELTVIGCASSAHGLARGGDIDQIRLEDFLEDQGEIEFRLDHDDELIAGHVQYAERSAQGLMVVGRVRTNMLEPHGPDDKWRMSINVTGLRVHNTRMTALRIREITLCRAGTEAGIGLGPCRFSSHDLTHGAGGAPRPLTLQWHDVWRRAAADLDVPASRRSPGIRIHDPDLEQVLARSRAALAASPKPRTRPAMPAQRSDAFACAEVLPPGVHRHQVGTITEWQGRPLR